MNSIAVILSFLLLPFQSQFGEVTGRVTDAEGPLAGALVMIGQTTIATTTDGEGYFTLTEVPEGNQKIIVRFTGYKISETALQVIPGKTKTLDITMEADVLGLDGIVVSANRYESNRKEAPVIVSVLGSKLLRATQSLSLSDGLNYQPGLRVETNCQNCGFTQVRMNGLDGPYTQILINSRAVFSSLISVYGLEQIPTHMIDRVEVVRSGGSALFGSNAIAGTINVITKEPVENTWQINNSTSWIDGRIPEATTGINGSYVTDDLRFGVTVFGLNRIRQPFDANDDGFTEMVNLENKTIGLKSYIKPSSNTKINFDISLIDEFRRGGNRLDLEPHLTDITEQLAHNIFMTGLSIDQFLGAGKHKLSAYVSYQRTLRDSFYGGLGGGRTQADSVLALNAYGDTKDASFVTGLQWNFFASDAHTVTSGVEYQVNNTDDKIPGYGRRIDQKVENAGLYSQWEWTVSDRLKLLSGARLDYSIVKGRYQLGDIDRSIDNNFAVLSPRFTMLYDLTPKVQMRGGYARGFRAPQAFNEDLHISSAGGEPLFVIISDDLTKELSDAYTMSFNYSTSRGSQQFSTLFEGFYTELKNPFVLVNTGSQLPNGSIVEEVRNGEGAFVTGLNTEFNFAPSKYWTFQSGMTVQKNRFKEEQVLFEPEAGNGEANVVTRDFTRTPNYYGYFSTTYATANDWQFSISGVFTGSMDVPEILQSTGNLVLRESPVFADIILKASYDWHLGKNLFMELSGGVQNLFNSYQDDFQTGPTRDSDYIYGPGRPRTFFVGIKLGNVH